MFVDILSKQRNIIKREQVKSQVKKNERVTMGPNTGKSGKVKKKKTKTQPQKMASSGGLMAFLKKF